MQKNDEKKAHIIYNKILKDIVVPIIGNKTTYMSDLQKAGKMMFGVKFKGVYPSDKIPKLNELSSYAILNLDKSYEPGSHWIAIAKKGNRTYVYDSFGRTHTKIIPNLKYSGNGRLINTDRDAEQQIQQTDCGARSLAWLLLFHKWGVKYAKLI